MVHYNLDNLNILANFKNITPIKRQKRDNVIEFYYGSTDFSLDFDKYVKVPTVKIDFSNFMSRNGELSLDEMEQIQNGYGGTMFDVAYITGLRLRSGIVCASTFTEFFVPEILIKLKKETQGYV